MQVGKIWTTAGVTAGIDLSPVWGQNPDSSLAFACPFLPTADVAAAYFHSRSQSKSNRCYGLDFDHEIRTIET
jgi:hypothetical protein